MPQATLLLLGVVTPASAASGGPPGLAACPHVNPLSKCWYMRVNSCLDDDMRFTGCRDVLGTPVAVPSPNTTLKKYDHFAFMFNAPAEMQQTMGNCTFEYTNANGNWVAFFDWTYAPIGDEITGGGTNDVIDNENTVLGNEKNGGVCYWLSYAGREAWDDCYFNANDTTCQPDYGAAPRATTTVRRVRKAA